MRRLTIALLIVSITGCSGGQEDPAPVIRLQKGAELCDEVSAKLGPVTAENPNALNCDFAYPVPVQENGTMSCGEDSCKCEESAFTGCITFTDWCVEQHANGVFWNTGCIMEEVTACDQVETLCNVQ